MDGVKTIVIPYKPRSLWAGKDGIHSNLDKYRFSVIVAHRRFGKTLGVINQLIKKAITFVRKDGRFSYIAPFRNQAKAIAWDYLKRYTAVIPRASFNESDLSVDLPNGSRIRIYGADNPDALRGLYFDGVVIDELADIKPDVWGEIIRPALADRKGWAIFIGTPKGQNLFFELYSKAVSNPEWFTGLYRADETGVLPKEELEALKETMAENQYRQEMLCDFTAATDDALISLDLVIKATRRVYKQDDIIHAPLIYGVDVARFGDDSSVLFKRRGLVAFNPKEYKKLDNMQLAALIAQEIEKESPDAVFIDSGGGAGVIDRLRQLGFDVTEVSFGGKPLNSLYRNKRAEMWGLIKDWLEQGQLPNHQALIQELTNPTYFFDAANKLCLEPKEKIKERIGKSPDFADALALTFAYPVTRKSELINRVVKEYDPFDSM